VFNEAVRWRRRTDPERAYGAFGQLSFDVAALGGLLFLTGGAANPLVILFVVPLTVGATLLPPWQSWLLAGLTATVNGVLLAWHQPLNMAGVAAKPFDLHVLGMWLALILAAALIARYVGRMGRALQLRERALAEAEARNHRDRHALALGTLATTTVHEMATPLGTISLLADELTEAEPEERTVLVDELRDEIGRCRATLDAMLGAGGEVAMEGGRAMPAGELIADVVNEWRRTRPDRQLTASWSPGPEPRVLADRTLVHALHNILDNADDASPGNADLTARWDSNTIIVEVRDRGAGMSDGRRSAAGRRPLTGETGGLGLGLFLSHTIVERLGGRIELAERADGGTCTRIHLPALESDR